MNDNRRIVAEGHIRARLRPKRGNSFYRDHNERETHTLCGAPVTLEDVPWNSGPHQWIGPICASCRRAAGHDVRPVCTCNHQGHDEDSHMPHCPCTDVRPVAQGAGRA